MAQDNRRRGPGWAGQHTTQRDKECSACPASALPPTPRSRPETREAQAARAPPRPALKASTSWCGRLEMKPTVSDRMTSRPAPGSCTRLQQEERVLGRGPGQRQQRDGWPLAACSCSVQLHGRLELVYNRMCACMLSATQSSPQRWVQRGKQPVFRHHPASLGQCCHERALAGIGVAHQRNLRQRSVGLCCSASVPCDRGCLLLM